MAKRAHIWHKQLITGLLAGVMAVSCALLPATAAAAEAEAEAGAGVGADATAEADANADVRTNAITNTDAPFVSPALSERAQIQTTGTLHVVEQRTFVFSQPTDVLRWSFTGLPSESEVTVASVRMAQVDDSGTVVGDWQTLQRTTPNIEWRDIVTGSGGLMDTLFPSPTTSNEPTLPDQGTWALDTWKRTLYTFFDRPAERVMFEVDWSATNAVAAYDDVAELYWDYVPARDDMATYDISASVQLPVPEGVSVVPNDTVLAWGHGAPGQLDIAADGTVSYQVPEVRAGQYAQAHILFPTTWLTNLSKDAREAYSGVRTDIAKAEEEAWTDTYSNQLVNRFTVDATVALVCAALLAIAAILYIVFGRERRTDLLMLTPNEQRQLLDDGPLITRFLAWNHVAKDEPDPQALTERMAQARLFDPTSFRLQKALFIMAVILVSAAVVALAAFGNGLAAVMLLVTGICIAIMANYLPRRTAKGLALAMVLTDRAHVSDAEDATGNAAAPAAHS